MTVIERLHQQVDIRGTASPFGALAADALAEIERLRNELKRVSEVPADLVTTAYDMRRIARSALVPNA